MLNKEFSLIVKIFIGIWMSALLFLWDSFIIFVLSRKHIRNRLFGMVYYIDKAAGLILGVVGVKLLQSAVCKSTI